MADLMGKRLLISLAVCAAAGNAAIGQSGQVFPPVPGPYFLAPTMAQPAPLQAPTAAAPGDVAQNQPVFPTPGALGMPSPPQPNFAGPVGAMRVPYWMQQTRAPQAPTATAEAAPRTETAVQVEGAGTAATSQPTAQHFGQAGTPGTFPGYMAPVRQWQAPQGQGNNGWGNAPAPGWGYAQQAPAWGTPYVPQAGWGYAAPRSQTARQ